MVAIVVMVVGGLDRRDVSISSSGGGCDDSIGVGSAGGTRGDLVVVMHNSSLNGVGGDRLGKMRSCTSTADRPT